MQILQPTTEANNIMAEVRMLWGPAGVGAINTKSAALSAFYLDDASKKHGNVWIVPRSGTVTDVGFFVALTRGTPPSYNVGVVTLDSSGNPTATPYGGSAITSWTPGGTGWTWVTLSTPATATAGDIAAAIVYPGSTAPTTNNYIAAVDDGIAPPGNGRYYTFSSWVTTILSTAMALRYDDGSIHGYALSSTTCYVDLRQNTAPDEAGCLFTLPVAMTCYGGRLLVDGFGWGTGATFDAVLYDSGDNVIASCAVTDKDFVSGSVYVNFFWPAVVLAANTTYRLILRANTGASGDIYLSKYSMESAAAMAMWPCGDTWQYTSRTDAGAWTDDPLSICPMGLWISAAEFTSQYGFSG